MISSATSPSSGMSSEQIDGEEVLLGGQKCVANFAKLIPVLVSKLNDSFFVRERPNALAAMAGAIAKSPAQSLKLSRVGR